MPSNTGHFSMLMTPCASAQGPSTKVCRQQLNAVCMSSNKPAISSSNHSTLMRPHLKVFWLIARVQCSRPSRPCRAATDDTAGCSSRTNQGCPRLHQHLLLLVAAYIPTASAAPALVAACTCGGIRHSALVAVRIACAAAEAWKQRQEQQQCSLKVWTVQWQLVRMCALIQGGQNQCCTVCVWVFVLLQGALRASIRPTGQQRVQTAL